MPNRQEALLFGGTSSSEQPHGDTWVWKSGCWEQRTAQPSPSVRDYPAATFDSVHGVVLLYGGRGGGQFLSDTWSWDGTRWTQLATSGPPFMFGGPVAGFDPVNQRPLLFGMVGGGVNETWSWDGSKWQHLNPMSSPTGRQSQSISFDPVNGQLLLFGGLGLGLTGAFLNETWTWTGATWKQLSPTRSPSPRYRTTMQSWTAGRVVILWGGVASGGLGDAWEWNGYDWRQIVSPGIRADAGAIDIGSKVIFFGGESPSGYHNDLWTFDGAWLSAS